MRRVQPKSRYWKFTCNSRKQFEARECNRFISIERLETETTGIFGRFHRLRNHFVWGRWAVFNGDGSLCNYTTDLFKRGERRVTGYFELDRALTLGYILRTLGYQQKKSPVGADFVFEVTGKDDDIPDHYQSQQTDMVPRYNN